MKYFKNTQDDVYGYESNGSQDDYIDPDMIEISEAEAFKLSRSASVRKISAEDNARLRYQLATQAALNISVLQAGIAVNCSDEGDSDALTAWQEYLCDLRGMTPEDLQQSPASFPTVPTSIF